MKKIILLTFLLAIAASSFSQVYDGITQPTKYRIWVPVNTPLDGSGKIIVSPFAGLKIDAANWLTVTPVFQYALNTNKPIPQLWVNFNYNKRYYLLLRNIYDLKADQFRETVSGTIKLPAGFLTITRDMNRRKSFIPEWTKAHQTALA
jgi:hypothetical protein